MPRSVIALFSQSLPRPFPHSWRLVWRTHLVYWMDWLLALFFCALPWFAIPRWFDAVELPKALLSVGVMAIWFFLRGLYSFLGSWMLEGVPAVQRRWSAFSFWISLLGLAACASWAASSQGAISWFGNGIQISSSLLIVLTALWLIGAVYEATQRSVMAGRFFLRAWCAGMCVALFGSFFIRVTAAEGAASSIWSVARILDLWLFAPVVFITGLGLLATRSTIESPLTFKKLFAYRTSHAVLGIALLGLLIGALLIQLAWLWLIILGGSVVAKILLVSRKRFRSLAGFLALLGILSSLFGLAQFLGKVGTPAWLDQGRQFFHLTLSELLPAQTLSWEITKTTLQRSPVFGAGPANWSYAFDQARPLELNQTPIWNVHVLRSASIATTALTEYGLGPSLLAALFLLILVVVAVRVAVQSKDSNLAWHALFVVSALVFAALRPPSTLSVISIALLIGLLAARVFLPAKTQIVLSEQRVFSHSVVGVCLMVAVFASMIVLQRAAAAQLLTMSEPYALPLARRLNPADDFTFAREAALSLQQAEVAASQSDIRQSNAWLDRADQAITEARTRNPHDPEHVALALQSAHLRAQTDEKAEDRVLELAKQVDARRPTDPSSPLAVFTIQRLRVVRETRWVEQGQGREKEEAIQREAQAKTAAEQALQESLRRKPDYVPALYAQAAWLAQAGDTKQAITALEKLAQTNPASSDVQVPLALLYRRNQEPLKAVATLQKLVEQAPTNLEYQWQLSLALIQAERWTEATAVLQRLVTAEPRAAHYQTQLQEVLRRRAQVEAPITMASSTSAAVTSTSSTVSTPSKRPVRRRTTR